MADDNHEYERAQAERKQVEAGRAAYEAISNGLNNFNDGPWQRGFLEAVGRDHRTLQQGFGRLIVQVIEQAAKNFDEGRYDLRNEDWSRLCAKIIRENKDAAYLRLV